MNIFSKEIILRPYHLVISFVITIALIWGIFFISSLKDDVDVILLKTKVESQSLVIKQFEKEITEWKKQTAEVIKIKNEYRNIVKEIIDLLYLKNMPMGGTTLHEIKATDEITIKMLRDAVYSFREEQEWMNNVQDFLVSRKQFINDFPFIYPVGSGSPARISSGFGFREDVFEEDLGLHFHTGVDFPGNLNDPIIATADGEVIYINKEHEIYGKIVILEHKFNLFTYYAHLNVVLVKIGQNVERGEKVGLMGETGLSQGVHLHYEVRLGKDSNSVPLDPKMFLSANY